MLVLSRKRGESIVIGEIIRVVVVEIRGDKVRLGVDAPRQVTVDRSEIAELRQFPGSHFYGEKPAETKA